MHDHFFLIWLTVSLIIVPAAWFATFVGLVWCVGIVFSNVERVSNSLYEKRTQVKQLQVSVLSKPVLQMRASFEYFETHIVDTIERLTNVALSWKSIVGWFKRVLFGTTSTDASRTIDAPSDKRNVKAIDSKRKAS